MTCVETHPLADFADCYVAQRAERMRLVVLLFGVQPHLT